MTGMTAPRSEVARREPVPVPDLMKPLLTLDEALRVSDVLCKSDMVPRSMYGKQATMFQVIMTGQALGLHWTEAPRVIFSPGPGQIGMRAQFLLWQVRKAGHRYTIEPLPDACKVTIKRGDTEEVFESTFTIDDAIQGGLVTRKPDGSLVALSRDGKPMPWMQWDKKMLRWRAVTDVVSFAVPEAGLGFEVDGGTPEPPQPVELRPESPAPPEPSGKAAPADDQAAQAERLRVLDEHTKLPEEDEPFTVTLADAKAMEPAMQARPDPHVGGIPEGEPGEGTAGGQGPQDFAGAGDTSTPATPEPGEDTTPAGRAKQNELAKAFAAMGYPPKQYKAEVLHACSVFTRRPIASVTDMTAGQVLRLLAALTELGEREDELAPVSRLAAQIDVWEEAWRAEDPDGYSYYVEGK